MNVLGNVLTAQKGEHDGNRSDRNQRSRHKADRVGVDEHAQ